MQALLQLENMEEGSNLVKKISSDFKVKIDEVMSKKGLKQLKKLEFLGKMLRALESTIARMKGQTEYLKTLIRLIMKKAKIEEHTFGRTTVQMIYQTGISKSRGEKVKKRLVKKYGKRAQDWVIEQREIVTSYVFSPEVIKKISEDNEFKKEIFKILENTPTIKISETPKRIKEGREKTKRKK